MLIGKVPELHQAAVNAKLVNATTGDSLEHARGKTGGISARRTTAANRDDHRESCTGNTRT